MAFGLGRPKFPREARGMNKPNGGPTIGGKMAGPQTDGVSLTEGFKTVSPQGDSPRAVTPIKAGKTPGAPSY